MVIDLSFEGVCKFVKNEYPELTNDIDAIFSVILAIGTTLAAGPMAATMSSATADTPTTAVVVLTAINTLSSLFTVKNEFPKIANRIIDKVTSKKDKNPHDQLKRMEQAYYLICYTAFFEALGREKLLTQLIKKVKLTREEKLLISKSASKKLQETANPTAGNTLECDDLPLLNFPISLPHPVDSFEAQSKQLLPLYEQLVKGTENFLSSLIMWEHVHEKEQAEIKEALKKLPEKALASFQAQYYLLAANYQEFYIWSNLQEHEKTRTHIQIMSDFTQKYVTLAETSQKSIDTGFKNLAEAISNIPEKMEMRQANRTLQNLESFYKNTLNSPIFKDTSSKDGKPTLTYPKKSEIFIPQTFKVLRYTGKEQLENEDTWKYLQERNDLGAFLLSYFSHPASFRTPLIILGQPGSGKSLLTSMLAARLISPSFTPIKVELRNVNADADVTLQIKEQIYNDTSRQVDWATLADHFADRPALVLLDGYDELLQATGKVFSSYLSKVQHFQERELSNERQPVRTIVTSRITLIDKAVIPEEATIIQLKEFDPERQRTWIALWNSTNAAFFQQSKIEPFELPENNKKINELAKQPLLLMMLALYDSRENQLRKAKMLDQTLLYNNLLRQFIERELKKEERFQALKQTEMEQSIDHEIERLGVAAIGMFNRRSLSIQATQLDTDLKFFDLEREVQNSEGGGYPLSPAELLLGSFFFVQESKALHKSQGSQERESDTAFEFLHNTFGEFLTADFMLRKIFKETDEICEMKKNPAFQRLLSKMTKHLNSLESDWFACFMFTPLFSRPIIVTLMREWLGHCLRNSKRDGKEFLEGLDSIITSHIELLLTGNTLPPIMTKSDQRLFTDLPTIGHIAIYTLNLILLRTILSPEGYIFDETARFSSPDGTGAWERLTYLWRSWFSLETLNELAAILTVKREDIRIHLKIKDPFGTASSDIRLNLISNVAQALADNITAGLSRLLLHDSWHADNVELDDISKQLLSEEIDLSIDVLTKRLRHLRRKNAVSFHQEALSMLYIFREQFLSVLIAGKVNTESYTSLVTEVIKLVQETDDESISQQYGHWLHGFPLKSLPEELALAFLKLARLTKHLAALNHYGDQYTESVIIRGEHLSTPYLIELSKLKREGNDRSLSKYLRQEIDNKIQDTKDHIPAILEIEAIKLAHHFGDKRMLVRLYQTHLEEKPLPTKRMPLDLVIEMAKLAREFGDQSAIPYFMNYLMEILMSVRVIEGHISFPNQLVIEVIRLMNEVGTQEILSIFVSEYILRVIKNDINIPTESAIELMRLLHKIGNQMLLDDLALSLIQRLTPKKHIPMELATELIKFAREVDNQEILDYFSGDYLREMLQTQRFVPVVLALELIKLAQKTNKYDQASIVNFYHKNITDDRCFFGLFSLDTITDIHRLAEDFGDYALIRKIDQKLGLWPV